MICNCILTLLRSFLFKATVIQCPQTHFFPALFSERFFAFLSCWVGHKLFFQSEFDISGTLWSYCWSELSELAPWSSEMTRDKCDWRRRRQFHLFLSIHLGWNDKPINEHIIDLSYRHGERANYKQRHKSCQMSHSRVERYYYNFALREQWKRITYVLNDYI